MKYIDLRKECKHDFTKWDETQKGRSRFCKKCSFEEKDEFIRPCTTPLGFGDIPFHVSGSYLEESGIIPNLKSEYWRPGYNLRTRGCSG